MTKIWTMTMTITTTLTLALILADPTTRKILLRAAVLKSAKKNIPATVTMTKMLTMIVHRLRLVQPLVQNQAATTGGMVVSTFYNNQNTQNPRKDAIVRAFRLPPTRANLVPKGQ